jgi:hypothetical protein
MKAKGIPFWERHIEHLVLGLAALLFVAYTALQFVGNPNAVEVKGQKGVQVDPGSVDAYLEARARELQTRLAPEAPAAMQFGQPRTQVTAFRQGLEASVAPAARLDLPVPMVAINIAGGGPGGDQVYYVPRLPQPTRLVWQQNFESLRPEVVSTHPQLQPWAGEPPHDVTWVTPAAVLDLAAVRREFQRDDPEKNLRAIPSHFYENRISIVDVRVEREELVDGAWRNLTTLPPLPGGLSFRPMLAAGRPDRALKDQILRTLADPAAQAQVVQPDFFETTHANWEPPDPLEVVDVAGGTLPAVAELQVKLSRTRKKLQEAETRLANECKDVPEGAPPPGSPPSGGSKGGRDAPGGEGGGMGGSKEGRRDPAQERERQRQAATCRGLRLQRDRHERAIARYEREIVALGGVVGEVVVENRAAVSVMDADQLVVWAHDVTVAVGGTYRYRFTVDLYNPFFGQKIALVEAQQKLADSMTLPSETSAWSGPVRADPPQRFFVTRVIPPAGQGVVFGRDAGRAMVDVYRFFDGRWWLHRFNVQPGERIGGTEDKSKRDQPPRRIDFGTEWFPVDIIAGGAEGLVLLQNLRTGELRGYVDPGAESARGELARLKDLVDQAELDEVADPAAGSAGAGAGGGGGAGAGGA